MRQALFCSVFLLSSLASIASGLSVNRFGRSLLQREYALSNYLLPVQFPQVCTGADCCQEDDYTSAFKLTMMNSSSSVVAGRQYTTFFLHLNKAAMCDRDIDKAGCCDASITSIWVDVDPDLNVIYSTINGQAVETSQSAYGFQMKLSPPQYSALNQALTTVTITVAGGAKKLCPIPDIAPVNGLCDIIIEGDSASKPGACCPRGLTLPNPDKTWQAPAGFFHCNPDMGVSPLSLAASQVSSMYMGQDGNFYVDYAININRNPAGCDANAADSCCGMRVAELELKVLKDTQITGVSFDSQSYAYNTADWYENGISSQFKVLSVSGLTWTGNDVSANGKVMTVTVQVPASASTVPQLCSATDKDGLYGACSYYLFAEQSGQCCPSGQTLEISGPSTSITCQPTTPVTADSTNMLFTYYENFNGPKSVDFVFLLNNLPRPTCDKQNCVDICSWSLAINENIIQKISYSVESDISTSANTALTSRIVAKTGVDASLTFPYPRGSSQSFFRVRTPVATTLTDVCRKNAHPDQGDWPCVAVLNSASVYTVAFFDQNSLAIKEYPDFCPNAQDISKSCIRPSGLRFNSPDANSDTSMEFTLTAYDPSTGCESVPDLTFKAFMQKPIMEELAATNSLDPSTGFSVNTTGDIEWTILPSNGGAQQYRFKIKGAKAITSVCYQGLPDQPAGSCMVQLSNSKTCFNGYVTPIQDPNFTWYPGYSESSKSRAGVIAPAVILPVLALVALVVGVAYFMRKRRNEYSMEGSTIAEGRTGLRAALTADDGLASSGAVDTSNIHLNVGGRS